MKILLAGEGRFIHTYMGDGNPLPSFEGEPKRVEIDGDYRRLYRDGMEQLKRRTTRFPCSCGTLILPQERMRPGSINKNQVTRSYSKEENVFR